MEYLILFCILVWLLSTIAVLLFEWLGCFVVFLLVVCLCIVILAEYPWVVVGIIVFTLTVVLLEQRDEKRRANKPGTTFED